MTTMESVYKALNVLFINKELFGELSKKNFWLNITEAAPPPTINVFILLAYVIFLNSCSCALT